MAAEPTAKMSGHQTKQGLTEQKKIFTNCVSESALDSDRLADCLGAFQASQPANLASQEVRNG